MRGQALAVATLILGASLAWSVAAQQSGRVATTVDGLLAEPSFFHGRQVAFRSAVVQERSGARLAVADAATTTAGAPRVHPVFVYWRQAPTRSHGEIRGEFWDLGRLREDDARFTAYDFKPVLEAVSGGRWPNRDEVFVLLGASLIEAADANTPTIRAIAMTPAQFADRGVTVAGRFRGRNLFGDLPNALNLSRWDFVLQSSDAAIWVTGLRPRGQGFELDAGAKMDTGRFLEVSGTVHVEGSKVWIAGESLRLARPPSETDDVVVAAPVIKEAPPAVIFTAPLADETDVPPASLVRVQFSRDMDGRTFRGRVRVSYLPSAAAGAPPPGPVPTMAVTYREANRGVEVKFAQPLERFQNVKVDLLEGILAMDGQPLAPWSMTFSVGAK
ncbi:MAG: Ig-like domain-containing protein [Vicinamibacterales bacterium]